MALPQDYVAALMALSRVFGTYFERTGHHAVLVGGASVAIYTDGQFPSGDFDVVAASGRVFRAAMLAHGFVPETRIGKLRIGYHHPDHPGYGYQEVSGSLFDGRSDRNRLLRVIVTVSGDAVMLPAVEDLIADRLAQHHIASPTDRSRLLQARALYVLAEVIDKTYLLRRITEEGGDAALLE